MTLASFLPTGSAGAGIIAAVVVIAIGAIVWAVASAFTRERRPELSQTLSPYSVGQIAEAQPVNELRTGGPQELVETAIVQRAVAAVGDIARQRGILQRIETKLEQANLPVRANELFFLYLVAIVVAFFLGLIGNLLIGVILAVVVGVAPWGVLNFLAEKRTTTFTSQLPDMLQLLATTLRSGFSILQGLETVSRQLPDPIGEEMRHVVAESRLGRPLIQALDDVASKVHSDDFDWVVQAIAIQREVGGNLAELLDIVAATMQERERLRREVKTLTAEGRIGAIIISILPVAIGLFVYAVNPSYISPLWHSLSGKIALFGSIGLAVVGIFWLRNIVQIEI